MNFVIGFFVVFGLLVLYLILQARKAGPRQLPEMEIDRGIRLVRITRDEPGSGWGALGSRTEARGIDLRFDHDDDPQAEAKLPVPDGAARGSLSHRWAIRLGEEFETHHVHTSGYVFQVRLRGTGRVIGKEVLLLMKVDGQGKPHAGMIENDDDTDAAVGDWIEVEFAEVVQVR